ncbi:MAG: hypothetical protein LRY68_09430 [Sulfurospirillum sp.]|nr:hypothetical protein [Sulfurospirillum sp.]
MLPYENDILQILENAHSELERFLENMNTPLEKIAHELCEHESISRTRLKEIIDDIL